MQPAYPPDDPREWLRRASSNLAHARARDPEVVLEDLCFDAQQAAEKAIKAVFLLHKVSFPYVHNLRLLLDLLKPTCGPLPEDVERAGKLSKYATGARYPGFPQPIMEEAYEEALRMAEAVVRWARGLIEPAGTESAGPPTAAPNP